MPFKSFAMPLAPTISQSLAFTHRVLPNVTEEVLAKYFQSLTSSFAMISDESPIDDHFFNVDEFMSRHVPSD